MSEIHDDSTTAPDGGRPGTMATVLARLADLQSETAPIDVTIGGITAGGTVTHNEIIIRRAAPRVVKAVVNEFDFVYLDERGLRISVRTDPKGGA